MNNSSTPLVVPGVTSVQVAAGGNHSLALAPNGIVHAWGDNSAGQLGVTLPFGNNSTVPVTVSGLSNVMAVAAGDRHSVALKADGTVWAWGQSFNGELGNGTNTDSAAPVQVSGLSGVIAISSKNFFTLALKSDGTVWIWGLMKEGPLNAPVFYSSNVPVQISQLANIARIAAGYFHAFAVRNDGLVLAWGRNLEGQLGDGTQVSRPTPVGIAAFYGPAGTNFPRVMAVAAGGFFSLALKENGTVWSWGDNSQGQLGNGAASPSVLPAQIPSLSSVGLVAAGPTHGLAVTGNGSVVAWGNNSVGQLGNGSTVSSNVPVPTSGVTGAVGIEAGQFHSLAVTNPVGVLSTTVLSFGSVQLGSTSAPQNVTLTNLGAGNLTISGISISGTQAADFSIVSVPGLPLTLTPGNAASLAVQFDPGAAGARAATLSLASNAYANPHSVELQAIGVSPADLALSQTVVSLSSRRFRYTMTVNNAGPGGASNVTLTDPLPNDTRFISVTPSQRTCSAPAAGAVNGTVSCTLGTMASGALTTVTMEVDVTANGQTTVINTATVTSSTNDPSAANNTTTLERKWIGQK